MKGSRRWLPLLLVCTFGCKSTPSTQGAAPAGLDPRLGDFLQTAITDRATLDKEKRDYASYGISFEQFIYSVYTHSVAFDNTPDNSRALAQLGEHLEKKRPVLAPELAEEMETFYADSTHQTFIRGMFLTTVKGLTGTKKTQP